MSLLLLLTVTPLGVFLFWASLSMIRQKWMYLLVGDAFMPGKPSLAMLPGGLWMATLPFGNVLLDAPEPVSGIFALLSTGCLAFGPAPSAWTGTRWDALAPRGAEDTVTVQTRQEQAGQGRDGETPGPVAVNQAPASPQGTLQLSWLAWRRS